MTTKSKILLCIAGAAVAGVAVGLLIAPDKGTEMRKKIKKTTGDWADSLVHLLSRTKDKINPKENMEAGANVPAY